MNKLNRNQIIFSSIGTALGLALATYIGYLIAYAGKGATWTVILGYIIGTLPALSFIFLSKRMVVSGGAYGLISAGLNPVFSSLTNYLSILTMLVYASNPLAIATYVISLAPGLSEYSTWVAFGAAVLCFFIVIANVAGMGKIQSFFTAALLVGIIGYIVAGIIYMGRNGTGDGLSIFDLSQDLIWAENGMGGIFSGFTLSMPLMCMYKAMLYYGPITENPKKNIPLAMYFAMALTGIAWIGTTIVTTNVLPVAQSANQPLTIVAKAIMPNWMAMAFVVFGPLMAIITTYIGNMPGSLAAAERMANEGWLPRIMGKTNKAGRPWVAALVLVMTPMILVLMKIPLQTVQSYVILLSSPAALITHIAICFLPKKLPAYFSNAKDRTVYYILCGLGIAVSAFQFFLSVRSTNLISGIVVVVALVAIYLFCSYRAKKGAIKEVPITSYFLDYEEVENKA